MTTFRLNLIFLSNANKKNTDHYKTKLREDTSGHIRQRHFRQKSAEAGRRVLLIDQVEKRQLAYLSKQLGSSLRRPNYSRLAWDEVKYTNLSI